MEIRIYDIGYQGEGHIMGVRRSAAITAYRYVT